ncbi:MAG: PorV/PorQ family protein [Bacteroidia bacterium]|nr:PorV/PorQ family protein [Bacteroidia bacterium]MCZ2249488.1 PorV/PorQ family protein [Bacteroidia bacterium]
MNKRLTLLLGILTLFSSVYAQAPKYSNEFLAIGVGSQALGVGKAVSSTVNDVSAAYWNPAGLIHIENNMQAAFMHSEYFAGIAKYDYGAVSKRIDSSSVAAFSVIRFGVDDIPNTTELINSNGQIDYNRITTFSAADYAFMGSYSRKLAYPGLSFGANAKVVRRLIGDFANSWGFGVDAGLQYQKNNLKVGLMLRDITGTYNAWSYSLSERTKEIFTQTGNEIPVNSMEVTLPKIIPGISYCFKFKKFSATPSLDLDVTTDGKRNVMIKSKVISIDPHFGLELDYNKLVFLRAGINNIQEVKEQNNVIIQTAQPNFGVGVKIYNITLDYALTNVGQQVGLLSHVFTIRANIDAKKKI